MKGWQPAVILLSLWCLAFGVSVASAEDPTLEKCTCDLDKNKQPDNGATVVNASACWATEDPSRQWCEIAVAYLEGANGKRDLVVGLVSAAAQSNSAAIATQLKAELDVFANAFSQTPSNTKFSPDDIRGAVGGLIDKYVEQIAACVKQFGEKSTDFKPQEADDFACTVGEATGWLRLEFRVGETRFIYMVAPNA